MSPGKRRPKEGSREGLDLDPIQWLKDLEIAGAIQAVLTALEPDTGLRVDVDSEDGTVYLRGEVASDEQKAAAERIARSVDVAGVKEIRNELVVNPYLSSLPNP